MRFAAGDPIRPGRTDLWADYTERRRTTTDPDFFTANGGIGTPAQVREQLAAYAEAGVDQMIFIQQSGKNRHDDICDALELFAAEMMGEFAEHEAERQAAKAERLGPVVEAAMARKQQRAEVADDAIPSVLSVMEGFQAHQAAKAAAAEG